MRLVEINDGASRIAKQIVKRETLKSKFILEKRSDIYIFPTLVAPNKLDIVTSIIETIQETYKTGFVIYSEV